MISCELRKQSRRPLSKNKETTSWRNGSKTTPWNKRSGNKSARRKESATKNCASKSWKNRRLTSAKKHKNKPQLPRQDARSSKEEITSELYSVNIKINIVWPKVLKKQGVKTKEYWQQRNKLKQQSNSRENYSRKESKQQNARERSLNNSDLLNVRQSNKRQLRRPSKWNKYFMSRSLLRNRKRIRYSRKERPPKNDSKSLQSLKRGKSRKRSSKTKKGRNTNWMSEWHRKRKRNLRLIYYWRKEPWNSSRWQKPNKCASGNSSWKKSWRWWNEKKDWKMLPE